MAEHPVLAERLVTTFVRRRDGHPPATSHDDNSGRPACAGKISSPPVQGPVVRSLLLYLPHPLTTTATSSCFVRLNKPAPSLTVELALSFQQGAQTRVAPRYHDRPQQALFLAMFL
jgi:hypothetical protein